VPKDDPTLLFTGAGMNQFKEKFLGRNITYKRAATSQKCLRTGDLENVGRTSGHHTFFEMLGNFSFGDYFKADAIKWAWEFFTKELKIDPKRLWVSVYKDDDEAYKIWKDEVKVPADKIIKFGEKENFWPSEAPSKGPNGPCGPCSEIFYDYGRDVGCGKAGCTPECDCGRFVEVWNLVFTQFDRQQDGSLKPLPNKNIDTGMGLERIASVMQGVKTNFQIDIFVPVIKAVEGFARPKTPESSSKMNAIADHIRAVTFCIADGVMPSNEERGYVVRKLIRRSMTHAKDLGIREPFLYKLVAVVADAMKAQYPEVLERRDDIAQVVKREEESFLSKKSMMDERLSELKNLLEKTNTNSAMTMANASAAAFQLYDTYGIPLEFIEEAVGKINIKIDKKEFEEKFEGLLEEQRRRARSKTKIKGEIFSETFAKKVEALGLKTEFLGYEKAHAEANVLAVLDGGEVILDRTPFYGESGGQAGDWGKLETKSGAMEVEDAKKIGETIVHIGSMLRGKIEKGETAKVSINEDVRNKTMRNHTATHLLQAALRKVLGEHVRQTGSFVDQDRLRFDFTHMKKLESREVERVEEIVNEAIKKSMPVKKEIKAIADAKKEGAMALFGEKYGDKVRVVSVGDISKELCGGTHVENTKDIGIFRITSESSIASGIRRIEAVTGKAAEEWIKKQKESEEQKMKSQGEKEEKKKFLNKRLNEELAGLDALIAKGKAAGGSKIISAVIGDIDIDGLRTISDKIRLKEKSVAVVLATRADDKAAFIISVTEDLVKKNIKAGDLAKELAGMLGGSGGGKPDFAQGGGKDADGLEKALEKLSQALKERLA
jgi:alanyl-tRNA synthetase